MICSFGRSAETPLGAELAELVKGSIRGCQAVVALY
jgi:hypothetical protein